jgi:hypothetical protein
MGWILGTKRLSEWERLRLHGRFGYLEMTRFLMIKVPILCRSSTGVRLCSVHSRHFSVWRIATSLWRCLRDWRTRPHSLFPNIGGCIAGGLKPTERHSSWFFISFLCMSCRWILDFRTAVCILVMQMLGVMLKTFLSNKTSLIEKITPLNGIHMFWG